MKMYITPDLEPTASALGPLARRGSRTSTHSAVRVIQWADSKRFGACAYIAGSGCLALWALVAMLASPVPLAVCILRPASGTARLPAM